MDTREFEYNSNMTYSVLGLLVFGSAACLVSYLALTNDTELILLSGLIRISVGTASLLYWVYAGFLAFFAFMGLLLLRRRLKKGKQSLKVGQEAFIIPSNLLRSQKIIRYQDIRDIKSQKINGLHTVTFITSKEKVFITNTLFTSHDAFQDAITLLLSKCPPDLHKKLDFPYFQAYKDGK